VIQEPTTTTEEVPGQGVYPTAPLPRPRMTDEEGSLVTEYGLLAVVAATIAGVVIQWASGGAIVRLFNALLNAARDLVLGG
jgi:Flp pilus assembly pilin Flp